MSEFDASVPDLFDPEHLKTLGDRELFEAVIDDVQLTITYLDEDKRTIYEDRLMGACWILNDEELALAEEWKGGVDTAFGNLASAIVNLFAEPEDMVNDPEEATRILEQRRENRALARIERLKQEVAYGVEHGKDEENVPWVQGSTRYTLLKILDAQAEAGIDIASEYVRETALETLTGPDDRGLVLLKNAFNGDKASYPLAVAMLQQAASEQSLGYEVVYIGTESITESLLDGGPTPERRTELKDLGIDMLARMRQWNNPSNYFEAYNTHYITTAADFAAALRHGATVA